MQNSPRRGMTLLELIIAVGLVAILAGIATLTMGSRSAYALGAQLAILSADIQSARVAAVQRGAVVSLVRSGNGWQTVQSGQIIQTRQLADGIVFGGDGAAPVVPATELGTFTGGALTIAPSGIASSGEVYLQSSAGDYGRLVVSIAGAPAVQRLIGGTYR